MPRAKTDRTANGKRETIDHHISFMPDIDKRLFDLSRKEGRSLSDLIREAVILLLDDREEREERKSSHVKSSTSY